MIKHTPGPWKYSTFSDYYPGSGVIHMNGVLIAAMITQTTHKDGEVTANARLIAASPTLLEACKNTLNGGIDAGMTWEQVMNQVREAIAMAEAPHD